MDTNNLTPAQLYRQQVLARLRSNVQKFTDCTEPGKPIYHDWKTHLARSHSTYTGYSNATPIGSWDEKKRLWYWSILKAKARRALEKFENGGTMAVTTKKGRARNAARVTTKKTRTYTRFNPHPKKYATDAARQKAYRARKKKA